METRAPRPPVDRSVQATLVRSEATVTERAARVSVEAALAVWAVLLQDVLQGNLCCCCYRLE